jgi:hypothetical protein
MEAWNDKQMHGTTTELYDDYPIPKVNVINVHTLPRYHEDEYNQDNI